MLSQFATQLPNPEGVHYPSHTKVYGSLSQEQKQVIKARNIAGSKTATDWLEFLNGLVLHDRAVSVVFVKSSLRRIILGIIIAAAIIGTVIILSGDMFWGFFSLIGSIMFLSALHYAFPDRYYKLLFPDYLYTVLSPLMLVLQEETEPTTLINVKVNLQRQLDTSLQSNRFGIYEWPFLEISTKLASQTDFEVKIHIQNTFRQRKSKSKRRVFIHMSFLYPKKVHQTFYPRQQEYGALKIKTKEKPKRHVLRLRKVLKFKDKPFNTAKYQDIPMQEVLNMMREGYKVIRNDAYRRKNI
ncbi:hypothetical protein BKI52_18210 [marine bacterium AO1-C]|nr:hypothetical protein BKI52_18210 [marine bacterium AO1-C]